MFGCQILLAIFCLTFSLSNVIYGDIVKCPQANVISGVNVEQLLGDWQMVQVIYTLRSPPTRTRESTDCSDLHVTDEGEDKLKFTYHDKYTLQTPAQNSTVLTYNVKRVSDGLTVDSYFDKDLKKPKPESNAELNSFIRTVVPGKYMILYICALLNSERIIVSKYLYARLTDSGLAISDQEMNEIIDNILTTHPSEYTNTISHSTNCYSRISH